MVAMVAAVLLLLLLLLVTRLKDRPALVKQQCACLQIIRTTQL
jgi:hypothetical protein